MFDIKLIREDAKKVVRGLSAKNVNVDLEPLLKSDKKRREILVELEELRNQKNVASDEIGALIKEKKDAKDKIAAMKELSAKISELEPKVKDPEEEINAFLLGMPNLAHDSVPVGGADKNKIVRTWGEPKRHDFTPKDHVEIAEGLDIVDFKRATKISGSNFILFKGAGARLERALFNFMLDVHTQEHGYLEIFPPFLVNRASMTGTGQLPKMEEDMYKLQDDDLFLVPTAEVPVTNIHRDENSKRRGPADKIHGLHCMLQARGRLLRKRYERHGESSPVR